MLKDRIQSVTDVKIGVLGLGYVGLPLAIKLADTGFSVIGIDINAEVVERLQSGTSTVEGLESAWLTKVLTAKTLTLVAVDQEPANTDPLTIDTLAGLDVFIVCVPTPLKSKEGWAPDLSYIKKARHLIDKICEAEARTGRLPDERLVVLESSTYPGTTKEIFGSLIDSQGMSLRWYLAYSPERMSPGPGAFDGDAPIDVGRELSAFQITRVVGGLDLPSLEIASALFEKIHPQVHAVSSLECAEMTKLVENTFRFVSIGFSNELSRIAKAFGLNSWEVIGAARTKKFGFELCFPGLIGGHCIPIDPHYLSWALRNKKEITSFVDVAERAHQDMKRDALELIQRSLNQRGRGFAGSSILFLGIAYKKDVGDIRESPALELMRKLLSANAAVKFWDPVRARNSVRPRPRIFFSEEELAFLSKELLDTLETEDGKHHFKPEELTGDWETVKKRALGGEFHSIVLATAHAEFDTCYNDLVFGSENPPLVDLTNGVTSWITRSFPAEIAEQKKKGLHKRSNYMLVGYQ